MFRIGRFNFNAASLAAAAAFALAASASFASDATAQTDLGLPHDDVWAYTHSSDPGGDPVFRVWGQNGYDMYPFGYPGPPGRNDHFSHAFMSWDLSNLPPDWQWHGATLTVTVLSDTVYDPAQYNVYVRLLTQSFDEDTFVFGHGPKPIDGDNRRVEGDDSRIINGPGSTITFEIPENIPARIIRHWRQTGHIDLAITSDCDFQHTGSLLRIATKENLLYNGPDLRLH